MATSSYRLPDADATALSSEWLFSWHEPTDAPSSTSVGSSSLDSWDDSEQAITRRWTKPRQIRVSREVYTLARIAQEMGLALLVAGAFLMTVGALIVGFTWIHGGPPGR